jgi:hypothetical protein
MEPPSKVLNRYPYLRRTSNATLVSGASKPYDRDVNSPEKSRRPQLIGPGVDNSHGQQNERYRKPCMGVGANACDRERLVAN